MAWFRPMGIDEVAGCRRPPGRRARSSGSGIPRRLGSRVPGGHSEAVWSTGTVDRGHLRRVPLLLTGQQNRCRVSPSGHSAPSDRGRPCLELWWCDGRQNIAMVFR